MSSWEEKFNELQSQHESMQSKYESVQNQNESLQDKFNSIQEELEKFKQNKTATPDQIYHGIIMYLQLICDKYIIIHLSMFQMVISGPIFVIV